MALHRDLSLPRPTVDKGHSLDESNDAAMQLAPASYQHSTDRVDRAARPDSS